jgi:hypothetical protein
MVDVTLHAMVRSEAIRGGHAIKLYIELSNQETLSIECDIEKLTALALAINNAGVLAERMRKAAPGSAISMEFPYRALDVRAGASADQHVILQFSTTEGPPVTVAMTPPIAQKTIQQLSVALTDLNVKKPPSLS